MTIAPTRRPRALIALGALALALAAAGPASAEPNQPTETAKRGCHLVTKDYDIIYEHGSTLTVTSSDGSKETFRCNDGQWEQVKRLYVQPTAIISASNLSAYTYPGP